MAFTAGVLRFCTYIGLIVSMLGIRIKQHTTEFLIPGSKSCTLSRSYCLVMLNSATMSVVIAKQLWDAFEYKICADGGANRLFNGFSEPYTRAKYIPDYIVGDLDSLDLEVKDFYGKLGCIIERDDDQDCNDLDKCFQKLQRLSIQNSKPINVVILGAFGGRFDQEIASIHALHKWKNDFNDIALLDNENVAFLLAACSSSKDHESSRMSAANGVFDCHQIEPMLDIEGPGCSLLPLAGPASSVWSSGLKWDLSGQELRLGGLISSSNQLYGQELSRSDTHTTSSDGAKAGDGAGSSAGAESSAGAAVAIYSADSVAGPASAAAVPRSFIGETLEEFWNRVQASGGPGFPGAVGRTQAPHPHEPDQQSLPSPTALSHESSDDSGVSSDASCGGGAGFSDGAGSSGGAGFPSIRPPAGTVAAPALPTVAVSISTAACVAIDDEAAVAAAAAAAACAQGVTDGETTAVVEREREAACVWVRTSNDLIWTCAVNFSQYHSHGEA